LIAETFAEILNIYREAYMSYFVSSTSTWSQYRNNNTVKYSLSTTPRGTISFISKGYAGRASYTAKKRWLF